MPRWKPFGRQREGRLVDLILRSERHEVVELGVLCFPVAAARLREHFEDWFFVWAFSFPRGHEREAVVLCDEVAGSLMFT